MIDLNYKPKTKKESWQPEEIAVAVIAVILWAAIAFGIGAAL